MKVARWSLTWHIFAVHNQTIRVWMFSTGKTGNQTGTSRCLCSIFFHTSNALNAALRSAYYFTPASMLSFGMFCGFTFNERPENRFYACLMWIDADARNVDETNAFSAHVWTPSPQTCFLLVQLNSVWANFDLKTSDDDDSSAINRQTAGFIEQLDVRG